MPEPMIEMRSARQDELPVVQCLAHALWHAHYPDIITAEQIAYMLARGYAMDIGNGFVMDDCVMAGNL